MAKSGVFGKDPVMVTKAMELKKELQKLVKAISEDDDDIDVETIDKVLFGLNELKLRKKSGSFNVRCDSNNNSQEMVCRIVLPNEFKCPLSKELMRDPVIVATGQTYDRPFIVNWLKSGNRTCPVTQQVLTNTTLTTNQIVREMISKWCKNHGIKLPNSVHYTDEDGLTESERDKFLSLLTKMSSSLPNQKEAAKELRQLTKRMPSFRALFGESPDSIPKLLSPLSQNKEIQQDLQEDIITTILNLSIHDNNKKLVAEVPMVIPILMDALKSGTVETKSNSAAAFFTLSALDSNKALIGKSGAIKPLIELLNEGHSLVMKDVASAIFNLCIMHENKTRAVRDGAVRVILTKIESRMHVDELLAILAMLSTSQRAIEEMGELGAVSCLLSIIRESSCARNKENCIAILYAICFSDRSKWREMREDETVHRSISQLAQNGTSRAKRKANGILERLNRIVNLTHTA